jgi:hypothetical protein
VLLVETVTGIVPPFPGKETEVGETPNVQPVGDWVTGILWLAMVKVVVSWVDPVFGSVVTFTVPVPVPDVGDTVAKVAPDVAVHEQLS